MIKSVWKPHYYKSKPIHYELVEKELLKLSKYLLEKPNAKKAFSEYASIILLLH